VLLIVFFVSACETPPKDNAQVIAPSERQALLQNLQHWQAVGRISINSDQQALAGGIKWEQRNRDYRVSLTSVLGLALLVEQTGAAATLQRKGRPVARGNTAQELVLDELNVRVPLEQLSNWLRGLPGDQGVPAYDEFGRLKQLDYRDPDNILWRADIRRYQAFDELDLPALVLVEGGGYNIRLTVREWSKLASSTQPQSQPETKPPKRLAIPGVSS